MIICYRFDPGYLDILGWMGIFSGEATLFFYFCILSALGLTVIWKMYSSKRILPFIAGIFLEDFASHVANRKSRKLSPFLNIVKIPEGVRMYLTTY